MRNTFFFVAVVLAAGVSASASQASTFNLANDFSSTQNPNGAWSFLYSGSPLGHVGAPLADGNPIFPAIGPDGYFSTGPDLNSNTPDVIKVAVSGSAAGETNSDFLAGDVIIHTPNDGAPLAIVWTAPSNGTISYDASFWYAHSLVSRSNDVTLFVNGVSEGSLAVNTSVNFDRSHPGSFSASSIAVTAGETLSLDFMKSSLQTYGSLDGVQFTVDFTSTVTSGVPEASTWVLMLAGFAGLGLVGWRRSRGGAASQA